MPARKPSHLSNRHSTKAEISARTDAEDAVLPFSVLTNKPPKELTGYPVAMQTWKKYINLQNETKTAKQGKPIITAFDEPIFREYCMMEQELFDLKKFRKTLIDEYEDISKQLKKFRVSMDNIKERSALMEQKIGLRQAYLNVQSSIGVVRSKLHDFAKSLGFTPRSRVGIAIENAKEETPDPLKEFD